MRDELFGDEHDYSKYDLLIEVLEKTPELDTLTSALMLTPDRNSDQGGLIGYEPGLRRFKLFQFLQDCVHGRNGRTRTVTELRRFIGRYCTYLPHGDTHADLFSDATRQGYFANIPQNSLDNALVFFDPDTGLETPDQRSMANRDEYLLWSDLIAVVNRASERSVFAVYQHYNHRAPKAQKAVIFNEKQSNLIARFQLKHLIAVSNEATTMFLFTRDSLRMVHLMSLLMRYVGFHQMECRLLVPADG